MGGYAVDPNQQYGQRPNPLDRFLTGAVYPTPPPTPQEPPQQPDLSMNPNATPDGIDMLGAGKMVTKPTLAMVGENGPEAVVPLTDQPGARVTPGMLGGMPKTRWGHPLGPNAAKRMSPINGALPIKPNPAFR